MVDYIDISKSECPFDRVELKRCVTAITGEEQYYRLTAESYTQAKIVSFAMKENELEDLYRQIQHIILERHRSE